MSSRGSIVYMVLIGVGVLAVVSGVLVYSMRGKLGLGGTTSLDKAPSETVTTPTPAADSLQQDLNSIDVGDVDSDLKEVDADIDTF